MKFISQDENKEDYFVTHDKKYIIRTISRQEHKKFLKEILNPYHQRVIEGSFLQRIYGHYKLTYNGEYVRVMVLENPYRYQDTSSEVNGISHSIKYINCLGDYSNEELDSKNFEIILSSDEKTKLFEILDKDTDLMHYLQRVDYLILLVAHSNANEDTLCFKAELYKQPIRLSLVISDFIYRSSSEASKKLDQYSVYPEASKQDIKETLSRIIK